MSILLIYFNQPQEGVLYGMEKSILILRTILFPTRGVRTGLCLCNVGSFQPSLDVVLIVQDLG